LRLKHHDDTFTTDLDLTDYEVDSGDSDACEFFDDHL